MHVDTHAHSTKSMALVSVHTWCCTNIPQHISVRQETTTHMWPSEFAHTRKYTHTFLIFSGVWLELCLCLSQGCTPRAEPKNTQPNTHKDALSLPTVNSSLYNLHLLKHMEGQVVLNQRKHLSMLLLYCWACDDKIFQYKLLGHGKRMTYIIHTFIQKWH